jgi:hypothetical protein
MNSEQKQHFLDEAERYDRLAALHDELTKDQRQDADSKPENYYRMMADENRKAAESVAEPAAPLLSLPKLS